VVSLRSAATNQRRLKAALVAYCRGGTPVIVGYNRSPSLKKAAA
jgi:hypothetical protein